MENAHEWTLYHGTFAHQVESISKGIRHGIVQASDFSACDAKRPFYTTRNYECAKQWAIQAKNWIYPISAELAVIEFKLDTTSLQVHDFGQFVTENWQNVCRRRPGISRTYTDAFCALWFTWKNLQDKSVTDKNYEMFDVIAGPMSLDGEVDTAKGTLIRASRALQC